MYHSRKKRVSFVVRNKTLWKADYWRLCFTAIKKKNASPRQTNPYSKPDVWSLSIIRWIIERYASYAVNDMTPTEKNEIDVVYIKLIRAPRTGGQALPFLLFYCFWAVKRVRKIDTVCSGRKFQQVKPPPTSKKKEVKFETQKKNGGGVRRGGEIGWNLGDGVKPLYCWCTFLLSWGSRENRIGHKDVSVKKEKQKEKQKKRGKRWWAPMQKCVYFFPYKNSNVIRVLKRCRGPAALCRPHLLCSPSSGWSPAAPRPCG